MEASQVQLMGVNMVWKRKLAGFKWWMSVWRGRGNLPGSANECQHDLGEETYSDLLRMRH